MKLALAAPLAAALLLAAPAQAAFDCDAAEQSLTFFDWADENREALGAEWKPFFKWKKRVQPKTERKYAAKCVRLNEVQVLGSHNSYHIQPTDELFEVLLQFSADFIAWEYTHLPLKKQFKKQGIRQIELDVFADTDGGLYASRKGLVALDPTSDGASGIAALDEPGFKVLHVQDLDFDSTCFTLVACLKKIRKWSDRNPKHLPLMIMIEAKDDPLPDPGIGFVIPELIGPAEYRALDAEILSVFSLDQIVTPDDVRAGAATLEEAVLAGGWPTLEDSRGKVIFAHDNGGQARLDYQDGATSLEGRILFTNSSPGEDDAAFVKANDPLGDPDLIPDLVSEGYIVRTRADGDTTQARDNDTTQRDAAIASGAQYVSTDYPVPNLDFSEYRVEIPDGAPGRCNPINAPPGCRSRALEK